MGEVLAAFDFRGDTNALMAGYDKVILRVVEISSARPVVHFAVSREYGLMVCDLWESDEALRTFKQNPRRGAAHRLVSRAAGPEVRTALVECGLLDPTLRVFDIHRLGWPVSAMPTYR